MPINHAAEEKRGGRSASSPPSRISNGVDGGGGGEQDLPAVGDGDAMMPAVARSPGLKVCIAIGTNCPHAGTVNQSVDQGTKDK